MKSTPFALIIGCIAVIFVISLWSVNLWIMNGRSDRGIDGDMFGAVTSLFTGLGFAGLVLTLVLQIRQSHESETARHNDAIKQRKLVMLQALIAKADAELKLAQLRLDAQVHSEGIRGEVDDKLSKNIKDIEKMAQEISTLS